MEVVVIVVVEIFVCTRERANKVVPSLASFDQPPHATVGRAPRVGRGDSEIVRYKAYVVYTSNNQLVRIYNAQYVATKPQSPLSTLPGDNKQASLWERVISVAAGAAYSQKYRTRMIKIRRDVHFHKYRALVRVAAPRRCRCCFRWIFARLGKHTSRLSKLCSTHSPTRDSGVLALLFCFMLSNIHDIATNEENAQLGPRCQLLSRS